MRILSSLAILAFATLTLHSCVGTKRTAYHQNTLETGIIQSPLIADLEVDVTRKVTATYRAYKTSEAEARQGALHEAMKQGSCDVIVHPVYETKLYPKVTEVNVSGICAKYKAIRKPTLEDVTIMQELKDAIILFNPTAAAAESKRFMMK